MSLRRALAPRSIHIRIVPRPANLSESREIYRVLQKFGQLDTFKYLRYEYQNPADNVALAIYRDERSAQRALDASPLRFALEKAVSPATTHPPQSPSSQEEEEGSDIENSSADQIQHTKGIDEILRPSQLANRSWQSTYTTKPPSKPTPMPFESPAPSGKQIKQSKWFQVTIDRSRAVHQDYIERQPFWKQFNPMKSMAQEDLAKIVPHPGLSDISRRPPNAHRTPSRVLKIMNDYVETKMPTLRGIFEGSEADRAFEQRRQSSK
ncbi:hypothetical protein COCSADRAFT_164495 [Bipolaris sorokiniana ND90Pr]|uniref:RRM domain-containing protein n=1 Tax=Cochliobolus sativus (strain ND90Pr / ATCC 201652) TaxID=665912 RepID=M2SS32_COCSN|nr:uncharacterized protein COCSADRAFT_164495 [Bipolaris sorokiniana ND90Pr]EMD59607.1 hypothetical protein COCSADRAFT_164495 [Bipolaris sorokiniana ND90Pr]